MHPLELNDAQCKSLGSRSRSVLISSAGPKYILRSWPEGYKMFVHYKGPRWPSEVPAQVPTPDRAGNPNSTLIASTSRVSALSTSPHSTHQTIQHIRQFNTSDNSSHPTIHHTHPPPPDVIQRKPRQAASLIGKHLRTLLLDLHLMRIPDGITLLCVDHAVRLLSDIWREKNLSVYTTTKVATPDHLNPLVLMDPGPPTKALGDSERTHGTHEGNHTRGTLPGFRSAVIGTARPIPAPIPRRTFLASLISVSKFLQHRCYSN